MWRPKNWEELLDEVASELQGYEKCRELLEAGADVLLKAIIAWIQEQDETTFCPDEGDEFDCFLVPTRALQALQKEVKGESSQDK